MYYIFETFKSPTRVQMKGFDVIIKVAKQSFEVAYNIFVEKYPRILTIES
jgi:hypothetical protein